jgi:hypothetical protein
MGILFRTNSCRPQVILFAVFLVMSFSITTYYNFQDIGLFAKKKLAGNEEKYVAIYTFLDSMPPHIPRPYIAESRGNSIVYGDWRSETATPTVIEAADSSDLAKVLRKSLPIPASVIILYRHHDCGKKLEIRHDWDIRGNVVRTDYYPNGYFSCVDKMQPRLSPGADSEGLDSGFYLIDQNWVISFRRRAK